MIKCILIKQIVILNNAANFYVSLVFIDHLEKCKKKIIEIKERQKGESNRERG